MIELPQCGGWIECAVVELTPTMVALWVESPEEIPDSFSFRLSPQGKHRTCEVRSREGARLVATMRVTDPAVITVALRSPS